jgi:hypothetical protein
VAILPPSENRPPAVPYSLDPDVVGRIACQMAAAALASPGVCKFGLVEGDYKQRLKDYAAMMTEWVIEQQRKAAQ